MSGVGKKTGSYDQSPRFLTPCGRERYGAQRCGSDSSINDLVPKVEVELQLKENLADAMLEMPLNTAHMPGKLFNAIDLFFYLVHHRPLYCRADFPCIKKNPFRPHSKLFLIKLTRLNNFLVSIFMFNSYNFNRDIY